jgi:hypothetical protein
MQLTNRLYLGSQQQPDKDEKTMARRKSKNWFVDRMSKHRIAPMGKPTYNL